LTWQHNKKESHVDTEITIIGEPTLNPATWKFKVDRPVFPGGAAYFKNREAAVHSLLARRIFEIAEVETVLIADNEITVTKSGTDPWPAIGKQVGSKIREHIQSNDPAVSDEYFNAMPAESEIRKKVQALLENEVNPALGMHGGWAELVDVKNNSVYLRLGGGCQGCGSAHLTLKMGIEKIIREQIPEVGEVLDATDHEAGRSPYQP
jgi:NFU1 iron-sulfur cluster scaffold homolog, mitochondrial